MVLKVGGAGADIAELDRGLSAQLWLDVEGPRIGRGNFPTRIDRRHIYRRDRAARRQPRIHSIEIASVKSRRVYQGRVAQTAEGVDTLLDALVEEGAAGVDSPFADAHGSDGELETRHQQL